jgi:carbon storage regulator
MEGSMLVLSRNVDETIMIGDAIEIMVVDVKGGRVKIGIRAPQYVPVYRKEIYMAIKNENLVSSQSVPEESDLTQIADWFSK